MGTRRQHGLVVSLLLAGRPRAAVAVTAAVSLAAVLSGRTGLECLLVAATVLTGQLTVGWVDAVAGRARDRAVGRTDRPVALGWVEPGTVSFTVACATLVLVPLSVANGTVAGVAYLGSVLCGWAYAVYFCRTALSFLPWLLGYALLPAFLSYGGLGGGLHGAPPTWAMTVLAGLLGVGMHVLLTLPHLVEANETGLRHLPLRVALRTGAPRLLWAASAWTVLVAAGMVVAALTVGLRQ